MGIQNFPAALQPIIQQGFLEREFQQALRSRLGYRACADREEIAVGIGETLTKTRAGLKPSVTTPLAPATNTNLDNGLTPGELGRRAVHHHHQPLRRDHRPQHGHQPRRHRLAVPAERLRQRRAGGAQPGRAGAQRAVQRLFRRQHPRPHHSRAAPARALAVDDVRGFQTVFVNGVQTAGWRRRNPLTVTVGANAYTLVGATADVSNVSTAPMAAFRRPDLLRQRVGVATARPATR